MMSGPDQVDLEGVGLLEEVVHQVEVECPEGVECLEGVEGVGHQEEEETSQT